MKKDSRNAIGKTLLLLVVAGGFYGIANAGLMNERKQRAELEAVCDASSIINADLGRDTSRENGQKLLDSLRVNYHLKEGERVHLGICSENGVYALVSQDTSYSLGSSAIGFANRTSLEKYLASIKNTRTEPQ